MMSSRHSLRCALSVCLVVMSMLFAQLALAAYVCPGASDPVSMAEIAAGEPCAGMDTTQPVLCHQHSANAPQSAELTPAPTPSFPAIIQVLVVPASPDLAGTIALRVGAAPEALAPPDPVFLSTLRLRV